eukprot:c19634_g1_i2 orf=824-1510(+)
MNASRVHKRVYELFCKASHSRPSTAMMGHELHFKFFRQPIMFLCSSDEQRVAGVRLEKTSLEGQKGKGQQHAVGTGIFEDLECGLVLKSIGYKSKPLDGLAFDCEKGIIPNFQGRVLARDDTSVECGLYVVGWLKRGPSGIIGTNLVCAEEVVQSIVEDNEAGLLPMGGSHAGNVCLQELLRKREINFISFKDWLKINAEEIARGSYKGKPREKITSLEEMLKIVREQ